MSASVSESASAGIQKLAQNADPSTGESDTEPSPSVDTAAISTSPEPDAAITAVVEATDGVCTVTAVSEQPATSTGAVPVQAYVCDYSGTAPGATATFLKWANTADATSYYQDAAARGPRIEPYETWSVKGRTEGPLWTTTQDGRTLSTGAYDTVPYTWQIAAETLDQINEIGPKLDIKSSDQLG